MRSGFPELIAIDSIMGGYCTQLMKRAKFIELQSSEIISKTEKVAFSKLINQSTGIEKDETSNILSSCNTCGSCFDSVSEMIYTKKTVVMIPRYLSGLFLKSEI